MAFVEPTTLSARGVSLVPLALEHERGLQAGVVGAWQDDDVGDGIGRRRLPRKARVGAANVERANDATRTRGGRWR